jgi:DNA repair exonuclease SbcCD ATPase subunit
MAKSRIVWLLTGGLLLGGLLLLAGTAHAADASAAIARLLDVGWSNTPQARADADLQLEVVLRAAPSDVRALEASWLVLMQQRRFDEALKRIDEHLDKQPDDLAAIRAKAWVQTVLKNHAGAFLSLDRLSTLLTAHPATTDSDRADQAEAIAFLGRLIGYYGGPAADFVNQDERKALEKRLLDRLAESQRTLLEDARNSVLSKFVEITDESGNARDRAAATARAEKEKTLAELQTDKTRLDSREKELEERRTKLNSEYRAEMDELAKQDQPLVQQQSQLTGRANILNNDLANMTVQIGTLQQLASQEKSGLRQQQLLAQANALSLVASRAEADLLGVNRLLRGVAGQRSALQTRRVQAQANTASQIERIDHELAELGKRERRNDNLEKRASRPVASSTGKVRALSAQATALSTYDAFPLEAAKARLLESLK